jgi:putative ABC transport system permease protein
MGGLQETPIEPIVSGSIVLWSFLVAVVVGIISGTYPAIRASRLNPIDALRYE